MYTYNAVVTTLPKISRQNFENFLLQFQKLWKSDELSKKPTGQNVRLNMYKEVTKFRQACRIHAAKITENLFLSKSQKDSNAIFFEKSNSCFSPSFKKKFSSGYAESSCDHPVKKFLVKTLKTVCSNSGNDEKIVRLPKKISPQNVRLTCTMKFWQARRNFVPKNTKKFPELQKCWSYNFFNKFFFIKDDSLATENAILIKLAKFENFFSENPQICSSDSENNKKIWKFSKG